jgi:ribonucleoside-triphosphate reductase
MRTLNEIDADLAKAKEALTSVEGGTAEVYSRIVGYYRSVRNWNKGKREEYGERRLYDVEKSLSKDGECEIAAPQADEVRVGAKNAGKKAASKSGSDSGHEKTDDARVLLFVRPACPACPGAKAAVGKLGLPVDMVNADTEEGFAEATRHHVMSTPTAILLAKDGHELSRARDNAAIASFRSFVVDKVAS